MTAQDDRTLREVTRSITKNLNDFGYPGTFEDDIHALLRGETVDGIIGMFAQNMIDEAPESVIAAARRAADDAHDDGDAGDREPVEV